MKRVGRRSRKERRNRSPWNTNKLKALMRYKGVCDCMTRNPNIVYVGSKPPMNYVMALMQGLSMSDSGEVVLKARGRAISTAVDVAEICRRRFMTNLQVSQISIDTEELEVEGGGTKGVSSIEIVLTDTSKKAK